MVVPTTRLVTSKRFSLCELALPFIALIPLAAAYFFEFFLTSANLARLHRSAFLAGKRTRRFF
jgi:hypothetical protein